MNLRNCFAVAGACAALLVLAPARAEPLVDPTRPYNAAPYQEEATPRGPVLQSTFLSATQKWAVIGGRRVEIGDTFDGATITAIAPYEVRMTKAGREIRLRLLPRVAKQKGVTQ